MKMTKTKLSNKGMVTFKQIEQQDGTVYALYGRMPHKKTQKIVFSEEAMQFFFNSYLKMNHVKITSEK